MATLRYDDDNGPSHLHDEFADDMTAQNAVDVADAGVAPRLDTGKTTTDALQGLSKLLHELQDTQPGHLQLDALKVNLSVMMSYLALLTSDLPLEDQKEIHELADALFRHIKEKKKDSKDM